MHCDGVALYRINVQAVTQGCGQVTAGRTSADHNAIDIDRIPFVDSAMAVVAAVSGFLFERGANIVSSHQYSSDPAGGRFFMRTEFFLAPGEDRASLSAAFEERVASLFGMISICYA